MSVSRWDMCLFGATLKGGSVQHPPVLALRLCFSHSNHICSFRLQNEKAVILPSKNLIAPAFMSQIHIKYVTIIFTLKDCNAVVTGHGVFFSSSGPKRFMSKVVVLIWICLAPSQLFKIPHFPSFSFCFFWGVVLAQLGHIKLCIHRSQSSTNVYVQMHVAWL